MAGGSITSLVVALMSRRVNKFLIFALVLVIHLLWIDPHYHDSSFDDAESIGMSFYLLGVAALVAESRSRRLTEFLGGALLAMAVLCKEPFALMAIPTWATFLLLPLGDEGAARTTGRYVKFTLSGVAAVSLWLLAYLLGKRCLGDYITALQQYIPFSKTICVTYGVWKPAGFWVDWSVRFTKLSDSLVNFERLGVALPLLIASLAFARGKRWLAILAAWGVAAGGLYAVTLGGCFFEHYFMLGMTGLFFVMTIGLLELGRSFGGAPWVEALSWPLPGAAACLAALAARGGRVEDHLRDLDVPPGVARRREVRRGTQCSVRYSLQHRLARDLRR